VAIARHVVPASLQRRRLCADAHGPPGNMGRGTKTLHANAQNRCCASSHQRIILVRTVAC